MIKTLLLQQINKNNYEEKHSYSSICTHDNKIKIYSNNGVYIINGRKIRI